MKLNMNHVRIGTWNVAIFNADARGHTALDRQQLLTQLTAKARAAGLRVDRSVLVFVQNGQLMTFGDRALVEHFRSNPVPMGWTHSIDG